MPQIQIKKKVQVNLNRWLDRYRREGERGEEIALTVFSSFDAKTLVSTGSFGKWNKDAEWEVVQFGVSCSFISTVAELLSARRSLFIYIPIWVPRDLSVRDPSNTNKKKGFK
jgi:hypothetical protein